MTDLEHMLERQAQWQKSRQFLTWPEKIRMAEQVRESVRQFRAHAMVPRLALDKALALAAAMEDGEIVRELTLRK